MLKMMSDFGLKSDHMYTAGFASIGLTVLQWSMSKKKASDSRAQADRWGLFVGQWAPTFFALGVALKLEEQHTLPSLGKKG